jgi:hypothetical protein
MFDIVNSESIKAYRNRVMVYSMDLWQETDPEKRVAMLLYLSDAVTTLARLESEVLRKQQQEFLASNPSV